ncbi:MAG TPA: nucleotidyltransferase family protein [Mycobacteriales bacterium]|nr:nucleotidyltransferase family protein [Mycobacteriales bacterium]
MTDVTIATLRSDQSLHDAFRVAGSSGDRLAVVVDGEGRVTATVYDGDIRRAVLAGRLLDTPLSQVLSGAPLLLGTEDADDVVRDLFLRSGRSAIAVVDTERRLVGVRRLADVDPELAPAPAGVLMVGGRGERLRPLTDKLPKPLLKIGGAAIVERLIEAMRDAGVADVYLTVNYMAEEFEERLGDGDGLGVRLHYVREEQPLDTAGALSLLPPTDRPLLVSNGDLVTTIDFAAMLDYHRFHRSAITVAGVEYAATVPYGVLRTAEHHLLHVDEKPTARQLVNGGIYVLSPDVLRYVPGDRPFKMTDLIDCALRDGLGVTVFPVLERWSDIGSKEEFERVLYEFAVEEES